MSNSDKPPIGPLPPPGHADALKDAHNLGRLEQTKTIIGGIVAMGLGVLTDCGLSNDAAADYLHDVIEKMHNMPHMWRRMDVAAKEIVQEAHIDHLVREHSIPPKKHD
jgi:hypothetical protein